MARVIGFFILFAFYLKMISVAAVVAAIALAIATLEWFTGSK
ncbi:hypothetical protein [Novosphingobium sp. JCM 18896]|nr:hypothetical protein [Novosphingobium sp. JCM 18896]MCW1429926.1 hypothetical protein [Novosphingobium sp. JCM 18896]